MFRAKCARLVSAYRIIWGSQLFNLTAQLVAELGLSTWWENVVAYGQFD